MQKPNFDAEKVSYHFHELLGAIGEDPDREGLVDTPDRKSTRLNSSHLR